MRIIDSDKKKITLVIKKRFARERGCDIIRELVFEIEVVAGGKAV